jgi:hypothetical protein
MERGHGSPVPIEIGRDEKAFFTMLSIHDVLLLSSSLNDVEDPVQSAGISLHLHIWSYVILVYLRCLDDPSKALLRVLLDMLLRAWIYQVDLQIVGL